MLHVSSFFSLQHRLALMNSVTRNYLFLDVWYYLEAKMI